MDDFQFESPVKFQDDGRLEQDENGQPQELEMNPFQVNYYRFSITYQYLITLLYINRGGFTQ